VARDSPSALKGGKEDEEMMVLEWLLKDAFYLAGTAYYLLKLLKK